LHGRRQQRFLDGVLASVEVPVATDQGAEHVRCQLSEEILYLARGTEAHP
jgi:hypothetical protein